jgi:hypothetical protein
MPPKGGIRFLLPARLVRMGGPSSGMAHFPFTKRAETQTSPPLLPSTALTIPCTPPFRL